MARPVAASRLKLFVSGLAALSATSTETTDEPRDSPSESPRAVSVVDDTSQSSGPARLTTTRVLAQVEEQIRRQNWSRAQRLLEEATRRDADDELISYLAEVRAVRRTLRQLSRRPRDAQHHLELGRLYFGLELGDSAMSEFRRAVAIEPAQPEAHFYIALEHLFRGEETACRQSLDRAAELRSGVPSYESLSRLLHQGAEG